jgi:GTP pyrophosphokinase
LRKKAEGELKNLKKTLAQLMTQKKIPAEIFFRLKRQYSIYNKMKRQEITFDQVYDFMALRLITDSVENCYSALGSIHNRWPHIPNRFRDFIAMPKPNLYQALHTTIITEKKQTIEIQIRTKDMHNLAENGISAHWRYKDTDPQSILKEDRRLLWLREMVDLYKEQKSPREFLKALKTDLIPEEVHVFTPKGKVISLPLGATALDFAFKIHTEIGLHASIGKVNGNISSLKSILKTGDIVEIITAPEKWPSRDWLNTAFTSTARHHIKRWLNHQERMKNAAIGKKLWEKELKKYSLPSNILDEKKLVRRLSQTISRSIKKIGDFYSLLGFGKVILNRHLMENIFPDKKLAFKKDSLIKKVVTKVGPKPKSVILVKHGEQHPIRLGKCCFPIKGESIVGYITAGKGVTVHSSRCPLVTKDILDHQRMVDASWASSDKDTYKGRLAIRGEDSPGVLAKLTSAIAQQGGNIVKADVATSSDKGAQIKLTLQIQDIRHFQNIIKKISGIKEILSVERI